MQPKISNKSKFVLIIAAILLSVSIIVPIWRIELDAPQYPEGLLLQIYSNKIGGQVEIINGLNHYIGMKTLHEEEFVEFKVLPYIIGGFALLSLLGAILGYRKLVLVTFISFVLFGIAAMVDFWWWEYDYGHNLNPHAAIVVPGMAYQPPLIGFKQLLNFGAYSVPDLGGWALVASGIMMLIVVFFEYRMVNFLKKKQPLKSGIAIVIAMSALLSCSAQYPESIKLNKDDCDYCKMTIADGKFGAELITEKGRVMKFDDLHCMLGFEKEHAEVKIKLYYVHDYSSNNVLIDATKAIYVRHEELGSPMGGNVAAFKELAKAQKLSQTWNIPTETWEAIRRH